MNDDNTKGRRRDRELDPRIAARLAARAARAAREQEQGLERTARDVTDPSTYMGPEDTLSGAPAEGRVIGESGTGKVDGLAKITGRAIFADDIRLPRMAFVKLLRSPHPHARIASLDVSEALAMRGVLDVAVGPDLPVRHGAIPVAQDETALAIEKVRYVGEPVAAVCAVSEEIAWEACRRIKVVYELLDPVLSIDDALSDDKPIIHDWKRKKSNVLRRVHQTYGDVDKAFEDSDLVFEDVYEYPASTHVPLEAHCAVATPLDGGRLQVWSSTQNPHYMHRTLARVLGMDTADIRLIKPDVGAGYGGKCDTFCSDILAAYFARKLGRPVKMAMEREEVFYAHRGRHRTRMWLKMGMKKDGTITAIDFKAWADGGAYSSYGVVTSYYLGVFMPLPYKLEHYRFTSWRLYTNKPPAGPKRGHGAIQPRFALEVHLDRMARQLGLEPADVRLHNMFGPDSITVNGLRITSMGLAECMEQVRAHSGYDRKRGRLGKGRGVGIAASAYMCGALHPVYQTNTPHSGVQVKIDRSGRVTIFTGTADCGQGSNHMVAAIVAERLGIRPEQCTVVEADSDLCPVDLGSYSSRVTFMAGNAALHAADKLRKLLVAAAADKLGVAPDAITCHDGRYEAGERGLSWTDVVELAESTYGTLGATGSYRPPKIGSRFRRQSVGPSPAYSFTAQVAEVTVDEETGIVTVDRVWAAHDLGRTLHREIAEGQIEGCVYMGVGEAMLEEQVYKDGVMRTPSMLEYRVPTIYDTPEIHAILVESHDPEGPYGAKECGEGPQLSTVPAIANAIYDACGIWLTHPPFTPERVLKALRKRDRERARAAAAQAQE
ncbi:MAG: aldehyde oxidase [Deltaproteobacteria bacterium]|nr:MAG: aldehyde oxidase [Deltaproteobacteria bacterium]